ncbi:MAG: hypothetical protein WCJ30_28455 [Deltaproteobacteria bacterium]
MHPEAHAPHATHRLGRVAFYGALLAITLLPPWASRGYAPQRTGDVIRAVLTTSLRPYEWLAPVFHVATLLLVVLVAAVGVRASRAVEAYIGLNYLVIAALQSFAQTPQHGTVIHTGALAGELLLAVLWLSDAHAPRLRTAPAEIRLRRLWPLPLAMLAFWAPMNSAGLPDFRPVMLLVSPAYGLSFCLTTPVVIFVTTLFYPAVPPAASRATAFLGLLYGLLNLQWFASRETAWVGVLHVPLLVLSIYALALMRRTHEPAAAIKVVVRK